MFIQYICTVIELFRFQSSFQILVNLYPPAEHPPQVNTESMWWYEKGSQIVHTHLYRCTLVLHRGCTLESMMGLKKNLFRALTEEILIYLFCERFRYFLETPQSILMCSQN